MLFNRLQLLPLFFTFLVYPLLAWAALQFDRSRTRLRLFPLVNVFAAYGACVVALSINSTPTLPLELKILTFVGVAFACYLLLVVTNYLLVRRVHSNSAAFGALVFLFPILMLLLIRYVPQVQGLFPGELKPIGITHVSVLFLGISYLSLRLVHLALEVRNEVVPMPTLLEYLSYAFFVPVLSSGPITWYSVYIDSVRNPDPSRTPAVRSLLRIIVGFTKYMFLSTLANQLTYAGLLRDGHPHPRIDLVVAVFAYTLYLYCNFSGFCDMVIGLSGLLGIEIMENFNQPFQARNLQEFWNRWHITLSTWMRDLLFTPLVKVLVRFFGPRSLQHAIAASILSAFILVGIWHGVGLNFALFGLSQGLGVAAVHYYTVFLKKRLGKKGYARYEDNKLIRYASTAMNFVYFSASLFLFANSWPQMQEIFRNLV